MKVVMTKDLLKILDVLEKMSSSLRVDLTVPADLAEEREKLVALNRDMEDLRKVIQKSEVTEFDTSEQFLKIFAHLHLDLVRIQEGMREVHDLVNLASRRYLDLIDEKNEG